MKAIKLTQKQKDRLVEMANFYFPFDYHFWDVENDDYDDQMFGCNATYVVGDTGKKSKKKQCKALVIHWFEFCIRYLIPKIAKIHYCNQENYIYCTVSGKKNPIDILYKQYKNNIINQEKIDTWKYIKNKNL